MTQPASQKVLGTNLVIWSIATLTSFAAPMVCDSLTDGRSAFLRMAAHAFPLIAGMAISHIVLSRAVRSDQTS